MPNCFRRSINVCCAPVLSAVPCPLDTRFILLYSRNDIFFVMMLKTASKFYQFVAGYRNMTHAPHPRKKMRSEKCLTLSPRQTTEYTGLGLALTYRLLREGVMPSIPSGKGYLVPKSSLLEWIHRCGGRFEALERGPFQAG
jgi:excisionase family DNA binding protein